jgi:putative membrane protein
MDGLWIAFGVALGIAGSHSAPAQPAGSAPPAVEAPVKARLERRDEAFVVKAARAIQAEIEAGKLAATRGASEAVKDYARQVVDHHSQAGRALEEIAIKRGVTWPVALDWWDRRELKKLQSLSGPAFDRRYLRESGVDDHEDAVKLFRKAQKDVKDPELKAFFDQALPPMERHFEAARTIERTLADRGNNSASASAGAGKR